MVTYTRVEDALHSDLGDETVLLHLGSGTYYGLEGVGGFIWKMLARPCTVDEMVDAVVAQSQVQIDTCRRDITEFLAHLEAEGLVRQS